MQWYIPITIIPAVALLVLSTSNFIIALVGEIRELQSKSSSETNKTIIIKKISQLRILSNAIVSLYISIGLITVSAIILAWHGEQHETSQTIPMLLLGTGLIIMFIAITLLILYAVHAVKIRQEQFNVAP